MLRKLNCHAARIGILLTITALIAAMAGCDGHNPPPSQNLEIRTWYDLDTVRNNLEGNHILMNDIDSTTLGYEELASPTANEGKGWQPIVVRTSAMMLGLMGTLDGQGYEIRDLFINRPDEDFVGLFGFVDGGVVKDIGVVNAIVTGGATDNGGVGSLVGDNCGTVTNSYSAGNVNGDSSVGGLVGCNCFGATVSNSYSIASVSSGGWAGGLVGSNAGTVSNSYCSGRVTGHDYVGGLVGFNGAGGFAAIVSDSYSSANVTGNKHVGGLVGENGFLWADVGEDSTVSNSYSTGNVTGDEYVGGLVGENWLGSTLRDCYSTCNVTGNWRVGGLVGSNAGTVSNCYSSGSVTGNYVVGGLVGGSGGTVSDSFWDTETSGLTYSFGGTGETTAEMQDVATFSGGRWNIMAVANADTRNRFYVWNIVDGVTYPFLIWEV